MRYWERETRDPTPRVRQRIETARSTASLDVFQQRRPFTNPLLQEVYEEEPGKGVSPEIRLPDVKPAYYNRGSQYQADQRVFIREVEKVLEEAEHGDLVGLDEDDHSIYLTEERGDDRYLYKANTDPFFPTEDYHPATKRYVDDEISDAVAVIGVDDLDDVTLSLLTNKDILVYSSVATRWYNRSFSEVGISEVGHTHVEADITDLSLSMDDLSDVIITGVSSGEILKFTALGWVNNTLAEAGIAAASHTHTESDITDLDHYDSADFATDFAASNLANLGTRAHSSLTGIGSDDHHAESHTIVSHPDTTATGAELETLTDGSDVGALHTHDHGSVGGLSDDDHTQYALLAGRSGGQTLIGGIDAADDLILESTDHGTPSGDSIIFKVAGANRVTLDGDSGQFLIGASDVVFPASFQYSQMRVTNEGDYAEVSVVACSSAAAGDPGIFRMARSRGTCASPSAVQIGDTLARFVCTGHDGSDWKTRGRIDFLVDGAVSSPGVVPTSIVFSTSDGNYGVQTRLTIASDGDILVDTDSHLEFRSSASYIYSPASGDITVWCGSDFTAYASQDLTLHADDEMFLDGNDSIEFQIAGTREMELFTNYLQFATTDTNPNLWWGTGTTQLDIRSGSSPKISIDSLGVGFNAQSPMAPPDYTITNPTTNRSIDVTGITHEQLAQVVGTLLQDCIDYGLCQ